MISNRYEQQLEDVQHWLSLTSWSQEQLSLKEVERVQKQLLKLELIEDKVKKDRLLHSF